MKKILFISLSMLFAHTGDLKNGLIEPHTHSKTGEVIFDSDLLDSGGNKKMKNINAQALQDALKNGGAFEYMFLYINFVGSNDRSNTSRYVRYIIPTDHSSGYMGWIEGGISKLNLLLLQGWEINDRFLSNATYGSGSDSFVVYELSRTLDK